jgi:altronate hydrolase
MRKLLILDARDNVAVCLVDLEAGDLIEQDNIKIKVINRIARGHKIASKEIAKEKASSNMANVWAMR